MDPLRAGLVAAFSLAALGCLMGLRRVGSVPDRDARRGLAALLVLSGGWAGVEVLRLLTDSPGVKTGSYTLGLVIGLATVGAWLYFCSAYTGHGYHRHAGIRRLALGVYLSIVVVKLTNSYHGLYFEATASSTPFPRIIIESGVMHWVVTGLAYALTAVGFYMLYEQFLDSEFNTRAMTLLVVLTGLPAIGDILSITSSVVYTFNYEPIGVAIFAVGVMYVVNEDFVAMPTFWRESVIEDLDSAILLVDTADRVRDYNSAAVDVFPELHGTEQATLESVAPALATALTEEQETVALSDAGQTRYYLLTTTDLTSGTSVVGRAIILADVTQVERQRRELRRQNEQFDDFSAAITHELRNTLAIVNGYVKTMAESTTQRGEADCTEFYRKAESAIDRMERAISDLSTLARYGQTLDEVGHCNLESVAKAAWGRTDTADLDLKVTATTTIAADRARLAELFGFAYRFAVANDASTVTVSATSDGFSITDDGQFRSPDELAKAFEFGEASPSAEAGMLLPNLEMLARVHGWSVTGDPEYTDGVRLLIQDVEFVNEQLD